MRAFVAIGLSVLIPLSFYRAVKITIVVGDFDLLLRRLKKLIAPSNGRKP
jgi:hypothetical protein